MSDSLQPHGLQSTRLLHPWDFPGKSTGVGCHCLLHVKPSSYSFYFLFLKIFFFPPPSLKPRMQCLFKNALADEIFHCLACWRRGCQERASRHTKYFAFHANSSLITNSNQCFLARFPVLQVFQVERKGEISVIIF